MLSRTRRLEATSTLEVNLRKYISDVANTCGASQIDYSFSTVPQPQMKGRVMPYHRKSYVSLRRVFLTKLQQVAGALEVVAR